jgi:hypothetical protein
MPDASGFANGVLAWDKGGDRAGRAAGRCATMSPDAD